MRSLIFILLIGFGFVSGANTNGGGVFAVKVLAIGPSSVMILQKADNPDLNLLAVRIDKKVIEISPGFSDLIQLSYEKNMWVDPRHFIKF